MAPEPTSTPPARILLVEDDLDQAHLLKFLLENEGSYAVTLAQDGLRGSGLIMEREWDLVITDLNLPGADGMEVLDAARTWRPGTPVLATTGYEGPEYAERARRQGASDVLLKPLDRDDLLERVARLLSSEGLPGEEAEAEAGPADGPEPGPEPEPEAEARPEAEAEAASSVGQGARREAGGTDPEPTRVLAISVRPGDAEAGCGGLLLRHRKRGDHVVLLTLTHGPDAARDEERLGQAKAAGRSLGVRFFVGNAGSGEDSLQEDVERLVRGALREIRPDVVYVPTVHHADAGLRMAHQTALGAASDGVAILAYDPGDAEPDFVPDAFFPVEDVVEEKAGAVGAYDPGDAPHLDPDRVATTARFWARHAGGRPAEALRRVRGEAPDLDDPGAA